MKLDDNGKFKRSFSNAIGRWAAVGPYYAMFPLEFAFDIVKEYSEPGQLVVDPFAGRGSSIYAAATQERYGFGVEINPVGWVYAQAKLQPASQGYVERRLKSLVDMSEACVQEPMELSEFFGMCYSEKVLNFLITARNELKWKESKVDRTLMGLLLVHLHGKLGEGLSNQMRQTKAMGPRYSVDWWRKKNLITPPEIPIKKFLLGKIRRRYSKGIPNVTKQSEVKLGDSTQILPKIAKTIATGKQIPCSLLFTSPPYQGVTNYHDDQWLRLWLLGGDPKPGYGVEKYKDKFSSKEVYCELLESVFKNVSQIMSEDGTIYVRTSAREFTFDTTIEILEECFPSWKREIKEKPFPQKTQTHLFGDSARKPGEKDIILTKR
ncbi:site-specific DNA-methyltransferase [Candidatus Poribacteria bacterium]|nr:site-specific DNA-methyltransferase [Candidatus Poribacteria bacterium]